MTSKEKHEKYQEAAAEINAILTGETNMILKMSTINCILKEKFPHYYWVGFYCVNEESLMVGPYQGTLGCLHISYQRGVCGRAARLQQTQIVTDVHADAEHIACDSRTNSEIVVPVWDNQGQLIAVFDVDSTEYGAFDEIDQQYLEDILKLHFKTNKLVHNYQYNVLPA